MSIVNAVLAAGVGAVLSLFTRVPVLGLAIVALGTAVVLLLVIRTTSNQPGIRAEKRAMRACVYEIRLFNEDLVAMLRAVGELLRRNFTYLRLSLVPVLWMALPLTLLVSHLQAYYGYEGLGPGRAAVLTVRVDDGVAEPPVLTAPAGVEVQTPVVWMPSRREAAWRIAATKPGVFELSIRAREEVVTKIVRVSDALASRSPVRPAANVVDQLRYPAEPPLRPGSAVRHIAISYPTRLLTVLGVQMHWTVFFAIAVLVFMLALRRRFGVVL
jgi:hypothetical protein